MLAITRKVYNIRWDLINLDAEIKPRLESLVVEGHEKSPDAIKAIQHMIEADSHLCEVIRNMDQLLPLTKQV